MVTACLFFKKRQTFCRVVSDTILLPPIMGKSSSFSHPLANLCGPVSGLCVLFHWSVCPSLYQYHSLDYRSWTICFEIWQMDPLHFTPLSINWFSYSSSTVFLHTFPHNLVYVYQLPFWDFGKNLYIHVEGIGAFTIFCLLIHEHGMSIYLDHLLFLSSVLCSFSTQILYIFC